MRANEFITEMEFDSSRTKVFSKENPPSEHDILRAFVQRRLSDNNKFSSQQLIDIWNKMYGIQITLKTLSRLASGNDYAKNLFQKAIVKGP